MKEVFYKRHGHRYKAVSVYDSDVMNSMPMGAHLITVYPGGQAVRYKIDVAYASMIAAGRVAHDAICSAIHKSSEAKPKYKPLTPRQLAAWEEMKAAFGDDLFNISYGSASDHAEAGVQAMITEAEKVLTNPAVKKAYEHFLMVAALTKENE